MLDDVELRELRIFLAVLVTAMRETGAQRPAASQAKAASPCTATSPPSSPASRPRPGQQEAG
jgi:hypothetical protein